MQDEATKEAPVVDAVTPPEEQIKFPPLPKGHTTFYDNATQVAWVGFDLKLMHDKADVVSAMGWASFFVNEYWKRFFMDLMKRKQFENSPNGRKIADIIKGAVQSVIH